MVLKLGAPGVFDLYRADCLDVLPTLAPVDAVVCDPPYGLNFMGKGWDHGVPGVPYWQAVLAAMKPGAHLLAFGGTRTYHRLTCAIEDAGFEIRDCIMWVYGSGFPKSHNIGKAIDKAAGVEREILGVDLEYAKHNPTGKYGLSVSGNDNTQIRDSETYITAPATPEAQQWDGWGTALKPAWEPIIVARKPFKGTVANNVLEHGTGGINVDGCRVELPPGTTKDKGNPNRVGSKDGNVNFNTAAAYDFSTGRFPANLIHDGDDEVVALFPHSKSTGGVHTSGHTGALRMGRTSGDGSNAGGLGDTGSAARFFYCAKASKKDRDEGLAGLPDAVLARSDQAQAEARRGNVVEQSDGAFNKARLVKNNWPTVKPTALMQYLCRLVTPPGGVVLDPFMGSGSTGKAALREGFKFIGIEKELDGFNIAYIRCCNALTLDNP